MADVGGYCTKCGTGWQPGQSYCGSCGAVLGEPSTASAPGTASGSPGTASGSPGTSTTPGSGHPGTGSAGSAGAGFDAPIAAGPVPGYDGRYAREAVFGAVLLTTAAQSPSRCPRDGSRTAAKGKPRRP